MKIISIEKKDMKSYGKACSADVHCIHVKILDVQARTTTIIENISDSSWINNLDAVEKASYTARAKKTIAKLVNEILNGTVSVVTAELGEYLVSESAREALRSSYDHKIIPLAELWKEKVSGNPGFDFHTETPTNFIAFGEAKYRSKINPHTIAIEQIVGFINDGKDIMELVDLKNFASAKATSNALDMKKAFVAAFSINGVSYKEIFDTAINSKAIDPLLIYPEIFIIGIEI